MRLIDADKLIIPPEEMLARMAIDYATTELDYDKAIAALENLEKIRKAYESDYQVDDVIQVCAELWGGGEEE